MGSFIAETSNYILIFTLFLYVLSNFGSFFFRKPEQHRHFYFFQTILLICFHAVGYITLYMHTQDIRYFFFFAFQEIIIFAIVLLYHTLYPSVNRMLLNNTIMLLFVGFVMLGRLSFTNAVRQFCIATICLILSLFVPFVMKKVKVWEKMTWFYCGIGIFLLGAVWLTGTVTNGSKLAFKIFDLSFQPSEFVKISLVFFIACVLKNKQDKLRFLTAGLFSTIHVIIMVLSRDLGGAAIYCVAYVLMIYVASGRLRTLFIGGGCGAVAAFLAYLKFSHVRIRVKTWLNPWADMDKSGYQLTQSLFAIGTGGWLGMGLTYGAPSSIPYVNEDFIFSAIAEELGVIFSILLILLYLATILLIFRLSERMKSEFYRLILSGFGIIFGFQVLLTVGGGTRFIPLTGVTLPLISMGGSSLSATILMFSIIQGIYINELDYLHESQETEEDFEVFEVKEYAREESEDTLYDLAEKEAYEKEESEDTLYDLAEKEAYEKEESDDTLYDFAKEEATVLQREDKDVFQKGVTVTNGEEKQEE